MIQNEIIGHDNQPAIRVGRNFDRALRSFHSCRFIYNFGEIYRDTQGTTPQISVNTRSSCGERDCILYLQVAARQRHIVGTGQTFRGHV